jgi:hypothetical protein
MFNEWQQDDGLGSIGGILGGITGVATTFLGGLFGRGAQNRASQYQQGTEIIKQQEKEIAQLDTQAMIDKSSVFYNVGKKLHRFNKENPLVIPGLGAAAILYFVTKE